MPRVLLPAAVIGLALLVALPAEAQLVLGQYEDEAPLGTWNVFGVPTAPALALGGPRAARAWDVSSGQTNAALLVTLPRSSVTLSGAYSWASMFKYSLVNTGVVVSEGNLTAGSLGLDLGGFAYHWGDWALAASAGILENYGRPGIAASDGSGTYELDMSQEGWLRDYNLSAARRLSGRLSVGLGLNYATGNLHRTVVETSPGTSGPITITDDKSEKYSGFFLNGGLAWDVTDRLTAALVFRTPYVKKGEAQSSLRYQAPAAGTDILIEAEARNEYRQPWIVGAGVSGRFSAAFSVVADLTYFGWSAYRVTYFDEPLSRSFRDVLKAGAGVEYLIAGRLFGREASFPLRLGVSVDPQPMTEPRSTYYSIHAGTGFRLPFLAVDLAGVFGRESGSGDSLSAGKAVLSVTYVFDR
jgi:opacity protein-like surface antigen